MKVRAPKAIRFRFLKWSSHFCGSIKNKSRKSVDTTLRTSKNNIYHHIECLCARILLACVCLASVVASLYCISNVSFPFPAFPCLYLENDEKQNLSWVCVLAGCSLLLLRLGAPGFLLGFLALGCSWLLFTSWLLLGAFGCLGFFVFFGQPGFVFHSGLACQLGLWLGSVSAGQSAVAFSNCLRNKIIYSSSRCVPAASRCV